MFRKTVAYANHRATADAPVVLLNHPRQAEAGMCAVIEESDGSDKSDKAPEDAGGREAG